MQKRGFTLIELLVVIAIIALLLSILMPSLILAKEAAKRIYCLSNFDQLTLAWRVYAEDNDDKVVRSRSYDYNHNGVFEDNEIGWTGWNYFDFSEQDQLKAIKEGKLYEYCNNVKAYRCPVSPEPEGLRTYCITNQWWPGSAIGPEVIKRLSDVGSPARRCVFIDSVGVDFDAIFNVRYSVQEWNNIPNWRHNNGTTISFADGHAEHWKWKDIKRTVEIAEKSYEAAMANKTTAQMINQGDQSGNVDLHRLQKAVWGKLGYTP